MKPGIYVHLPFCSVRCAYCDFPLTTRLSLADAFYSALFKEISLNPPQQVADTLYFGGGTPSLTPPRVLSQIKEKFALTPGAEITLEANPDNINREHLEMWLDVGVNRLSIGVQSLESPVLQWMLRQHSTDQAIEAVRMARAMQNFNINVDLIAGAPWQTINGFLDGLRTLINLNPHGFSIYFMEVHENTALFRQIAQGKAQIMPEEQQLDCYQQALQLLITEGYEHYEVSNFALSSFQSQHNLKYWSAAPYYAYGPGACSYVNGTRRQNVSSVKRYIEKLQADTLPIENVIREDLNVEMRNALIFGLRKREGIDIASFEQKYGRSPLSLFDGKSEDFLDQNLLEIRQNRLRLTLAGMLVSNEILSAVI